MALSSGHQLPLYIPGFLLFVLQILFRSLRLSILYIPGRQIILVFLILDFLLLDFLLLDFLLLDFLILEIGRAHV